MKALSLPNLFVAVFLIGSASTAACSGSATTSAAGDPSCAALTSCCATIPGQTTQSCQEIAQAASVPQSATSCASVLQSYKTAGYCSGGASGGDGGVNGFVFPDASVDAALPCALTNTCPPTDTGSTYDAGASPGTCAPSSLDCAGGETLSTCVSTSASGACSAKFVFSDGTTINCASCTDCTAAQQSAELYCNPKTTFSDDAGSTTSPVDSGPSCGTAPTLHPEATAGVYCPFTANGPVTCAAGQQCCEGQTGDVSTCQPAGATCPVAGSLAWNCTAELDCAGNAAASACCATGTTSFDSTCSYYRGTGFSGSQCAASCGAGQVHICTADADCPSGTCTAFKVAGLVLGTCM